MSITKILMQYKSRIFQGKPYFITEVRLCRIKQTTQFCLFTLRQPHVWPTWINRGIFNFNITLYGKVRSGKFIGLCLVQKYIILLLLITWILFKKPTWRSIIFSCMFISILYMFRAAMCPSSGELIVSIRHLVYVTLYRWPFGVQVQTWKPNGSCIQSDIY